MKIVEIKYCDECPYFDNEYYTYNQVCRKGADVKEHTTIEEKDNNGKSYQGSKCVIPQDCPLAD